MFTVAVAATWATTTVPSAGVKCGSEKVPVLESGKVSATWPLEMMFTDNPA